MTRSFRDMSLTEDEAEAIVWRGSRDPSTRKIIIPRAKRLLPLWRQWGLRELFDRGFARGSEAWGGFHG